MDKLNCIKEYIESTKAYYLFMMGNIYQVPEWRDFILDKKNLCGAKVSFISNLMLGMKEEIVDNMGNLVYESKLFVNELEKAVEQISIFKDNGYLVDGYVFSSASIP